MTREQPYSTMSSQKGRGKAAPESSAGFQYVASRGNLSAASVDPPGESLRDGDWEVCARRTKNRPINSGGRQGASASSQNSWSNHDTRQTSLSGLSGGCRGNASGSIRQYQATDPRKSAGRATSSQQQPCDNGWEQAYMVPSRVVPPPLQNGWQWASRPGSSSHSQSKVCETGDVMPKFSPKGSSEQGSEKNQGEEETEDELIESDDEILDSDYDSDVSQKSHESMKKHKFFKAFFEVLDRLTLEELNDTTRQWHCPACRDGRGAIDWYKGFLPLITHAKTKGAGRRKLHRELACLLEVELQQRGASVVPSGETFGKWRGVKTMVDHDIVWPPMVLVRNTIHEQDEDDKWIGMGNQELMEYFDSFAAMRARHSYGPQGHRGISVLIFEGTAVGYLEAERLHKHFAEQGTDRDAWENPHRRKLFYPGGKRQLYGWLATKEDLDNFNQHCQGKSRLKFEMKSYLAMVVEQMKQMSEDNEQLIYLKNKVVKQQHDFKTLEQTMGTMRNTLRIANEENRIVRVRTMNQNKENKEEMDYLEKFFREKMAAIHEALEEKEQAFEQSLQEERAKVEQKNSEAGSTEVHNHRRMEVKQFTDNQLKGVEEFEAERERLIKCHEEKKTVLKKKYYEEEVELEKEFDAALTQLMNKYVPGAC